jgi:DNA-binding transcriptional MerR regulator
MRIGELAEKANVTVKTVRYYESLGLVTPRRLANGYRDYDEAELRSVTEIHELSELGLRVEQARPFLDCLVAGNRQGDDCPASLDAYRGAIDDLSGRIDELTARRDALRALLETASARSQGLCEFDVAHTD